MSTDKIHIACQTDARLAPDCAVMLRSLFLANQGERFEVHFLHTGELSITEQLGELVRSFSHTWSPLEVKPEQLEGLPAIAHYGGHACWYRLFLHQLLPELPRILYLDADILVVGPVRPLWESDLEGYCVGAVTGPLFAKMLRRVQETLGIPGADCYFNSGVLLLNLAELRAGGLGNRVLAIVRDGETPLIWPDQDALNTVLWPYRKALHPRWNAMNGLWDLPHRYLPWTKEEWAEARKAPVIIHFVGPYKPRHYRCDHPYRHRYFEHLEQTAWRTSPVEGRSLRNMLLRRLPPLWQNCLEGGELRPRPVLRRWLNVESPLGSLARDVYRWVTRGRSRPHLQLLLEALAYSKKELFFIQIGSNDATSNDPLRRFIITRGWRGIMVEPVPYVFERLQRTSGHFPGVRLENIAIGAQDGTVDFYAISKSDDALPRWYDQLGSFSLDTILKHEPIIPNLRERIISLKVKSLTFDSLCRKHAIGAIDLVHIDAEGFDYEIIKQINFDQYRPTALLYEHRHLIESDRHACEELLARRGYLMMGDTSDTLCIREEAVRSPWTRLGRAWRIASGFPSFVPQHLVDAKPE